MDDWKSTACILCSLNCGIEVLVDDGHFVKIRGDKAHPVSQGYQCQKASRLDFYQNARNRLTSPLRRRDDGTFEEISWDDAIREVAASLKNIRDTHGGHALAYYGGGGQGNHMGGAHASTLRAATRTAGGAAAARRSTSSRRRTTATSWPRRRSTSTCRCAYVV